MFFVFSFSFSAKKKKVASKFTTHLCPFSPVLGLRLSFHCAYLAFLFFFFFFFSFTTVHQSSPCVPNRSLPFSLSLFSHLSDMPPFHHPPLYHPVLQHVFSNIAGFHTHSHSPTFFFLSLSPSLCHFLSPVSVCLFSLYLSFFFPLLYIPWFFTPISFTVRLPPLSLTNCCVHIDVFCPPFCFFFVALSLSSSLSCVSLCLQ